ncbi:xylulokinase [Haloferula rosea]|uniref:Carbohydrate kinase n=1 Tax=Haloferula rosea TaxID=490093 RepID=A0A934RCU5_9BACT|nr:FGGY family carbohydrate kinase [Haloferula rosea]MBK1828220.1 carbohydrate kinase [Haloferula rosea]
MSYTLGIDSSTQSCSAIVIDPAAGKVVAEASVNFGERLPKYGAPSGFIPDGADGEVHSDPRMWLDALELMLEELGGKCDLSQVVAVSGAGQQHGSVYLNERWPGVVASLNASSPLAEQLGPCLARETSPIWMDGSTTVECREIADAVGGDREVCVRSGSIAIERFTGPQIRRFSKIDPEGYAATTRIHLVSSFLCSVLCGTDAPIDTGDGAGMNLLNLGNWDWDEVLLEATADGLRDRLPAVVQGDHVAGSVCGYFQKRFGFGADVPVTVFTGDNPSSLVGMGASTPGKVVVSLGTSDTFFAAMPEVLSDPDGCGHVFGNPSGGSMSLQCFINGSLAREAVKDRFGMGWDEFSAALASTPEGNGGKVMVPFFRPEISPRTESSEPVLVGGGDFESWKEPEAAVRACVEGQFINMRSRTRWMKLETEVIYLTGGASQNDEVAQVAADVFGAKVQRLVVSSSVALGGAMRAACSSLGASLTELEAVFCKADEAGTISPRGGSDYAANEEAFEAAIG